MELAFELKDDSFLVAVLFRNFVRSLVNVFPLGSYGTYIEAALRFPQPKGKLPPPFFLLIYILKDFLKAWPHVLFLGNPRQ